MVPQDLVPQDMVRAKGREELTPQRYVSTVRGCYPFMLLGHLPGGHALTRCALLPVFQKPLASVHNEFSTGHAASPCTIVIGRAHIEKVSAPARPYRMLNNFMINKKIDFNEDLSGKITGLALLPTALRSGRTWVGVCLQRGGQETKQSRQDGPGRESCIGNSDGALALGGSRVLHEAGMLGGCTLAPPRAARV